MAHTREKFSGNLAALLALAGSAIGLGNIWRFPYMVGENGGAAFIIIYLVCIFLLSLPIFISECTIGRRTASNPYGAFEKLAPGTKWKWIGLISVFTPILVLSYYSVVGGWSVAFLVDSLFCGFNSTDETLFDDFISHPLLPLLFHTVFLILTALIVSGGVKSGIEKFNRISLPTLFVLIIVITLFSLTLDGAVEGVRYLVRPDFSKVTPSVVASAVGQSFYSLSLGVGTVLTFSSYMKKEDRIIRTGVSTIVADLMFAVLAAFAIMPAVFAAGIKPGEGPGLIFQSLPFIFAKMSSAAPVLARCASVVFFLAVVIAALTSAISLLEVGTAYLVDEKKMSRRKTVAILFAVAWALGALCSLSFGPLSGISVFKRNIFSFFDMLTSNFLMTLGGLIFVIFVGWKMKKADVYSELTNDGTLPRAGRAFGFLYALVRYAAPLGILLIFITGFIDMLN